MLVPRKNQVSVGRIQVCPELKQLGMHRMPLEDAAAEQRMVPVGQNAGIGMFAKVFLQPHPLLRVLVATAHVPKAAIRVQHYNVPRAQIITVVALARRSRSRAPILKISVGSRSRNAIFMVPQSRPRTLLKSSPSRVVAGLEFCGAPLLVS